MDNGGAEIFIGCGFLDLAFIIFTKEVKYPHEAISILY